MSFRTASYDWELIYFRPYDGLAYYDFGYRHNQKVRVLYFGEIVLGSVEEVPEYFHRKELRLSTRPELLVETDDSIINFDPVSKLVSGYTPDDYDYDLIVLLD